MLRKPDAQFRPGRTTDTLKVKSFHDDEVRLGMHARARVAATEEACSQMFVQQGVHQGQGCTRGCLGG